MNSSLRWSSGLVVCCAFAAAAEPGREAPSKPDAASPAFVQTGTIGVDAQHGTILGFCVAAKGGLVAVTGRADRYGVGPQQQADGKLRHRLVWFDGAGDEARAVDLDFAASVVAADPSGGFCVAGDGVVAMVSAEGRELARATAPHLPGTDEEIEELKRAAIERRDTQLAGLEKQIDRLRAAVAELEKREKEDRETADADTDGGDDDEADRLARQRESRLRSARSQARSLASQLRQLESVATSLRRQDAGQLVEQSLRKARQVRAISVADEDVFVVTAETTGFGFAAWRLDKGLKNPRKVLSKLVGCCGQMDVQVIDGRLAVSIALRRSPSPSKAKRSERSEVARAGPTPTGSEVAATR